MFILYFNILFDLYLSLEYFLFIIKILLLLMSVAFLTACERKVLAIIQGRESIRWVGIFGILQPFADALKLIIKELIIIDDSHDFFLVCPAGSFICSLSFWLFLPLGDIIFWDFEFGIFGFYIISTISSYIIFFTGFFSNNIYSFIGSIRYISMVFSFELLFCLLFLILYCCSFTLNLYLLFFFQEFYCNFFLLCSIFFIIFLLILSELNRHPVDLGESEGDLVGGMFTEYSSMGFGLFFMGEYLNMFSMCSFLICIFIGYCYSIYILPLFIIFFVFLIIVIRGAYPRYRFDHFIYICWYSFFFFLLAFFFFLFGFEFIIFNLFSLCI